MLGGGVGGLNTMIKQSKLRTVGRVAPVAPAPDGGRSALSLAYSKLRQIIEQGGGGFCPKSAEREVGEWNIKIMLKTRTRSLSALNLTDRFGER